MISLHISFRENLLFGRQEEISTDHFHILRWFKAYFRDTKPFFQDKFNMQTYPFTSNITSELQKHFWVQSSETQTKFHIYFFSKRAGKKEIATHEKFALKYSYYKLKQTNKKKKPGWSWRFILHFLSQLVSPYYCHIFYSHLITEFFSLENARPMTNAP